MNWKTILAAGAILFTSTLYAQTPDGETPPNEAVCDSESGSAYGLCTAYCEAMDCDYEQTSAAEMACLKVRDRFVQQTGRDVPCELQPVVECPCWTQADIESLPMDGADAICTSDGSRLDIYQEGICEHSFSVVILPESALACGANRFDCPGLPDLGGEFIDTSESQFTVCLNQIINRCQELGIDPPEFP
jgi:hypothetical protein